MNLSKNFPGEAMLQRQISIALEEKQARDAYLSTNGLDLVNAYVYAVAEEMPDIFSLDAAPEDGLILRAQGHHSFSIIPQSVGPEGVWDNVMVEQVQRGEEPIQGIIENATHPKTQGGLLVVLSWWCENQCPKSMAYEFAQVNGWAQRKAMLTYTDWLGRNGWEPS